MSKPLSKILAILAPKHTAFTKLSMKLSRRSTLLLGGVLLTLVAGTVAYALLRSSSPKPPVVTLSDGSSVGCSLDPVEKGEIASVDPLSGTGTLKDKTGIIIKFEQNYISELGLVEGAKVRYATVTVNGTTMATALKLANN